MGIGDDNSRSRASLTPHATTLAGTGNRAEEKPYTVSEHKPKIGERKQDQEVRFVGCKRMLLQLISSSELEAFFMFVGHLAAALSAKKLEPEMRSGLALVLPSVWI